MRAGCYNENNERGDEMIPQAIIFDLDGVLCHTDRFHYQAWKAIADQLQVPFDETVNHRLRGVSRMESLEIILEAYDAPVSQAEKDELAEEKNELYRKLLHTMTPEDLSQEVHDTLLTLRQKDLRLAVGSSSKNARLILERIGLSGFFDAVSDGNNITRSKPDPEVFLKAAEYIQTPPDRCWVVEDAESGLEAARRAGMYAIAYGPAAENRLGDCGLSSFSELVRRLEAEQGRMEV